MTHQVAMPYGDKIDYYENDNDNDGDIDNDIDESCNQVIKIKTAPNIVNNLFYELF